MYTLTRINNRHAHTQKQMWREFPLAAGAFESSSGIPFLSLPNMGGFVRERAGGRTWNPPSWCQSSGTVSLTMTGNSQEGMSGMQESRKCCSLMHVCKIWVWACTHAPCAPTHTHLMFFASPLSGEISLPVKSYPPHHPPTPQVDDSLFPASVCVRPLAECGISPLPKGWE